MAAIRKRSMSPQFPPARNALGSLQFIDPSIIQVDRRYQRDEIPAHVRNIAMNFDYAALKPISVNQREDGTIVAIDGQQEIAAAVLRGDIPLLPCYVSRLKSVKEEARAMGIINGDRKAQHKLEHHRTQVCAGVPQHIAVQAACDRAGIVLVPDNPGPMKCNAIGSIMQWVGKRSPEEIRAELDALFAFLLTTWRHDPKALSGRFVTGVMRFLSQAGEQGKKKVLAQPARLGRNDVDYYLHKAGRRTEITGKTIVAELPQVLRDAFNAKLRKGSRI